MHPTLATIPTPAHLRPYVPRSRSLTAVVRFELGQIQPEPVPPAVYSPLPDGLTGDGLPHSLERRACPDCAASYQPKAWNQERCPPCGLAHRRATGAARKTTTRTRPSEPRPKVVSERTQKIRATQAIDRATRERARMGQLGQTRGAA